MSDKKVSANDKKKKVTPQDIKTFIDELLDDDSLAKTTLYKQNLKRIKAMVEQLDDEWIDTRIKTPRNTRKVIATTTDGFVGEMNYDPETKEWYHYGDEVFEGVIGWKEKPKPYKRKE